MRTAEAEQPRDAGLERGRHHRRSGLRTHGDDLAHAGNGRRNRRHQHRRGQGIASAGHVTADAVERYHALFDGDAAGHRAPAIPAAPAASPRPRMCRAAARMARRTRRRECRGRGPHLIGADLQRSLPSIQLARVARERGIAAAAHRRPRSPRRAYRSPRHGRAVGDSRLATARRLVESTILTARSCSADTRRCPGRPPP